MNNKNLGGRPRKPGGKGANKHCVFGNCKSDSRKTSSDYQFISFPKPCLEVRKQFISANSEHKAACDNCQKCNRWIIMCKRQDGNFKSLNDVKKDTYICTKHFVKPDLSDLYPDPLPEDVVSKLNNRSRKRKLSDTDAVTTKAPRVDNEVETNLLPVQISMRTQFTQTTFCLKDIQVLQDVIKDLKNQISVLKVHKEENIIQQFEKNIQKNEKMCKFYTNLCFSQIMHLIAFLDIPANINYWGETASTSNKFRKKKLTIQQQIILTLVRMRTGFLVKDLSFRFQLSEGLISKTVTTWIQYMFEKFNSIRPLMFPSRNKINESLPPIFKRLKNIRVILDCAEFFCQTPGNFKAHTTSYKTKSWCVSQN